MKSTDKNKTEDFPVPIEIIQKKKNKKQFKQERNQWILDMHKSTSDLDWKQQDIDNRKLNTDAVREKRKSMLNQNMMRDIADNYETILERDIEGTWIERGSNNLAGRIMTADIDFENNLIYCASAGGNIWKGTLDGEDWQSLTDYMQLWISFLRIFPTDNGGQRLLIGTDNNFYFSDNDAITLNESNGLGNYSIKRFIMQSGTSNIYALVNSSPKSIYVSTDLGENFEYLLPLNQSQGVSGLSLIHI